MDQTRIHCCSCQRIAEVSEMRSLVKVYSRSRVEFQIVDEKEFNRLIGYADRYGYKLKLVSNPDQDLPLVVQTILAQS